LSQSEQKLNFGLKLPAESTKMPKIFAVSQATGKSAGRSISAEGVTGHTPCRIELLTTVLDSRKTMGKKVENTKRN
jgi:hypothetical protein